MQTLDGRSYLWEGNDDHEGIESDLTRDDYLRLIREANKGYADLGVDESFFNEQADALLALAGEFQTGAVIERNGEDFDVRQLAPLMCYEPK